MQSQHAKTKFLVSLPRVHLLNRKAFRLDTTIGQLYSRDLIRIASLKKKTFSCISSDEANLQVLRLTFVMPPLPSGCCMFQRSRKEGKHGSELRYGERVSCGRRHFMTRPNGFTVSGISHRLFRSMLGIAKLCGSERRDGLHSSHISMAQKTRWIGGYRSQSTGLTVHCNFMCLQSSLH